MRGFVSLFSHHMGALHISVKMPHAFHGPKKQKGLDCQACRGGKQRLKTSGCVYLPTGPEGCGASGARASWGRALWGRLSPPWASAAGAQRCWTTSSLPRRAPPPAPRRPPSRQAGKNLPTRKGQHRVLTHCPGRRRTDQLHRKPERVKEEEEGEEE